MPRGKLWTEDETRILQENHPSRRLTELQDLLPNRTQSAINQRAGLLRLQKITKWSEAERQRLQENYRVKTFDYDLLQSLLPGRSKISIISMSQRRSLRKKRSVPDTPVSQNFERIFDGIMLGDGHIRKRQPNTSFCYAGKHRAIAEAIRDLFVQEGFSASKIKSSKHILKNNITYITWRFSTKVDVFFTRQRTRWYRNDKKCLPKDLLLCPLVVKHWFYGDGSLNYKKHLTILLNFSTEAFSPEEVLYLCKLLKVTVYLSSVYPGKCRNNQYKICISKSNINILLNYIGPCDPAFSCYQYKWVVGDRAVYDQYKTQCRCQTLGVYDDRPTRDYNA